MECVKINPSILNGEVNIPSSKSVCHRTIIAAGLAKGVSGVHNIVFSDDIIATCGCMKNLGIGIRKEKDSLIINGQDHLKLGNNEMDCMESGSTLRFIIPIALRTNEKVIFNGRGKLINRPLSPYYDIFNRQGIRFQNNKGGLPLIVEGELKGGQFSVRGDISSQFITGLLFALPMLKEDSQIILTTDLESRGYVDITIDMLKKYSIVIQNDNYRVLTIKGNQKYTPVDYYVEGDFSGAAFWMAAGVLGGSVRCKGLNMNSLQPDKIIVDIIKRMGGNVDIKEDFIQIKKSELQGITVDASQCPDIVPIISVLGALSEGRTKIINAGRLRIKESDRLSAISTELNKLGADVIEREDSLIITGKKTLNGGIVDSHNDHRIAMALSIASEKCEKPLIITNSACVSKSYPNFYDDFKTLGGDFNGFSMG